MRVTTGLGVSARRTCGVAAVLGVTVVATMTGILAQQAPSPADPGEADPRDADSGPAGAGSGEDHVAACCRGPASPDPVPRPRSAEKPPHTGTVSAARLAARASRHPAHARPDARRGARSRPAGELRRADDLRQPPGDHAGAGESPARLRRGRQGADRDSLRVVLFHNSDKYIALVGGQFQRHGTGEFTAEIVKPDHPALAGVKPFATWDETYVHTKHNPDDRTVLMEREDQDGREPYTWVRTQGKGRVFYTAFGHDSADLEQPRLPRARRPGHGLGRSTTACGSAGRS